MTATVKVSDGANQSIVLTAAVQAVEDFLQPFSWPWSNTLRYNQLIAILAEVLVSNMSPLSTPRLTT